MTAEEWIFEPRDFIRYWRSLHTGSTDPVRLPPRTVFVFDDGFYDASVKALHARAIDWNPRVSLGRAGRYAVAVVRSSIGAPAAAIELEESIALGARTIVSFGSCGSLIPELPIGHAVVPTAAFSDEGTSRRYGGSRWARPDSSLVHRLRSVFRKRSIAVREGGVWTTDAVYRESRSKARSLVRRGIVGVEMEASALFTIGRYRHVRVAGVLVVSDELAGEAWTPGFERPAFRSGIRKTLGIIVEAMSGGLA